MPRTSAAALLAIRAPRTSSRPGRWGAAADLHRVTRDPDPRSRAGHLRIVGYSPSARFVLTVIVDPKDSSGVTAWQTHGADLRDYLEGKEARDARHQ